MPRAKAEDGKRRQRKKKDPNAPKRAMSAFMFFSNEIRDQVRRERPDLQFLEIASEIGRRWQILPDSKRKRFQEMADRDKQRYMAEKEDYVPDPAFNQKTTRKRKDPNAPKRSLSAYLFYCNDLRAGVIKKNPGKRITEIATILAAQWKTLNDKKKAKYVRMAEEDKERYAREMEIYNAEKAEE